MPQGLGRCVLLSCIVSPGMGTQVLGQMPMYKCLRKNAHPTAPTRACATGVAMVRAEHSSGRWRSFRSPNGVRLRLRFLSGGRGASGTTGRGRRYAPPELPPPCKSTGPKRHACPLCTTLRGSLHCPDGNIFSPARARRSALSVWPASFFAALPRPDWSVADFSGAGGGGHVGVSAGIAQSDRWRPDGIRPWRPDDGAAGGIFWRCLASPSPSAFFQRHAFTW